MPRTQINCPQCRQPIVADVQQVFDVGEDPRSKQIFLAGAFNVAQCSHCGYQGMLSAPLIYHDPEKELLLTFFPPEMTLPREEQERMIGPLINRIVNNLPQEKRKGYLLNPRTMLTLQGMVETVLEADGITKEMIEAQEKRMNLIRRLLTASEDSRLELIKQEDEMIDGDFLNILSRLMEAAVMGRDENAARQLNELQVMLIENSTKGQELQTEVQEIEAALQSLRELGEDLTREKLLELVIQAPTDTRLRALTQLARPGMDYTFFQMLSQKIERARGKGRQRLVGIREKLLEYTQEVDQEMETRATMARQNLETLLQVDDIKTAVEQNIAAVDEFFIQAVTQALEAAHKNGDLERSVQLQQIQSVIEEAQKPPPEFALIEEWLKIAADESALQSALEAHSDEITPELLQMINGLLTQTQASLEQAGQGAGPEQKEIIDRLQAIYNAALGFSMRRSFKGG